MSEHSTPEPPGAPTDVSVIASLARSSRQRDRRAATIIREQGEELARLRSAPVNEQARPDWDHGLQGSEIVEELRAEADNDDELCARNGEHDICGYCEDAGLKRAAADALEVALRERDELRAAMETVRAWAVEQALPNKSEFMQGYRAAQDLLAELVDPVQTEGEE